MSDEDSQASKPPHTPSEKTASVPLKKETVRITLKSKEEAAPATPAAPKPAAPKPPAPAVPKAPAPSAPKAPAPAVQQLNTPPTAKATQQLKTSPAASLPKATVRLQSAPAAPSAPTISGLTTTSMIDDDEGEEAGVLPFAVVAAVLATVLLAVELMHFFAQ